MAETTTLRGTPRWPWAATAWTSLAALGLLAGCPSPPSNPPIYNNTTDPTNGGECPTRPRDSAGKTSAT
jgi:hypothetical protein